MLRFVFVVAAVLVCSFATEASARGRWRGGGNGGGFGLSGGPCATAQDCANLMARCGKVGHPGGNPGYEGCGCAGTAAGAYAICCYANSGMATVDVGYAQSSSGMWFCCRRYR